jgi:hypothetical protein
MGICSSGEGQISKSNSISLPTVSRLTGIVLAFVVRQYANLLPLVAFRLRELFIGVEAKTVKWII